MSALKTIYELPRKVPFFYGWLVAGGATLGIVSSIPGQTMGVSVFTPKLMEATGLSEQQISLAYGIGTITSGLLLVRAGRLIDIFGVRRMMTGACVGLGLVLLFFAQIGNAVDGGVALLGDAFSLALPMAVATVSFFLLRFTGQGLMTISPRVMIGKWWDKRRGRIAGLMGIFTAFGFGGAPLLLNILIERFGWQGAYYMMGGFVGIIVSLVCWLIYREQPQDFDLIPDGQVIEEAAGDQPAGELKQFDLSEVRRSFPFWVFCAGLGGHGLVITGVTFHIVALAENAGLTKDQGIMIFLPISILNVMSNFTGGWLSDRLPLKYILMFMMAMQALGTIAVINFGDPFWRGLAIVGYGLSGGLWGVLVNVTWPRFYGTLHLGAISGQSGSVLVIASALGPLILASSMVQLGGYGPGLVLCSAIPIAVLIAAMRVRNPQIIE